MEFSGRNVVVTGAGRGIGEALAREFHTRGANVVVADIAGTEAVADSLERATAITADVSTEEGNRLLVESARESLVPVKDYIIHAHMGNAVVKSPELPAYGDAHPRFGFPNGANDVEELVDYLRVLLKIGYLREGQPRILSFEVKPFADEEPEVVVANAKRVLNRAWALV